MRFTTIRSDGTAPSSNKTADDCKTLVYEAAFLKKKHVSREYQYYSIAGEYYMEEQYPMAKKFFRVSCTIPMDELFPWPETDAASATNRPPKKD